MVAFNWASLPSKAVVVDVGGGIGNSALAISKSHPELRVVIQDTQLVIEEAMKVGIPTNGSRFS